MVDRGALVLSFEALFGILLFAVCLTNVSAAPQLGTFGLDIVTVNGVDYYDINHYNFSARIVKSGSTNITNISRRVENSGAGGPNALYNKTSTVYPGDVVDLYLRDVNNGIRDALFLQKPAAFYNKSGSRHILTTNTTSSCKIMENTTTRIQVDCTSSNNDASLIVSYIADNATQQFFLFNVIRSDTSTALINTGFQNYYDYDVANYTGSETQDEFVTVVNSSQFGSGIEENIVREGIITCDGTGANELNLQKCSVATNDTFTVKQHLGSAILGSEIFVGISLLFQKNTAIRMLEGFTNPSTDTDGKREVPPEEINITSTDTLNKNDAAFVIEVTNGNLTIQGSLFKKFFGNAFGTTNLALNQRATERIGQREFAFLNVTVKNATTGAKVASTGAYSGINITALFANTGPLAIENGNASCNMTHSDGTVVLNSSFLFNMSATEPAREYQCGATINVDNSIKSGNYTIRWRAIDSFDEQSTTTAFAILSDFVGSAASFAVNKNYTCNENITFYYNLTNSGNQNFIGTLIADLFFKNKTFIQNVENSSVNFIKNSNNARSATLTYCDEWPQNLTLNVTYTIEDEAQGTNARETSLTRRVLGNAFSTFYGLVLEKIGLRTDPRNVLFAVPVTNTSNVYIVDSNSKVDFSALQAFGRTTTNTTAGADFTELDEILNISLQNQEETISSLYSSDGTAPKNTEPFTTGNRIITSVPVANSTSGSVYTTGILWDTSDDAGSNGEFDATDNEDVIFVVKVRKLQETSLGTADYVIYIPSFIRTQAGTTGGGGQKQWISIWKFGRQIKSNKFILLKRWKS